MQLPLHRARRVLVSSILSTLSGLLLLGALSACSTPSGGDASADAAMPSASSTSTDLRTATTATPESTDALTPVVASVVAAPRAAPSTDGQVHLAYELFLTNTLDQAAVLQSVAVRGDGKTLLELGGDAVLARLKVYGSKVATRSIGPGQSALVWFDVVVPTLADVPKKLDHRVRLSFETAVVPLIAHDMTETVAPVRVDTTPAIVVGPPLQGGGWLDGNSCCGMTAHRMAVSAVNGAPRAPERFAIDFVQVGTDGRFVAGDMAKFSSYRYYGANVIAVADGPIVGLIADLPEQSPPLSPTALPLDQYGGNSVVQDIGNGHYAFYAHLQRGNPLRLAVGQMLRRGQRVGLLGNTGNSDSPHLHFHIMDGPSPLGSDGLPFLIDSFVLEGRVRSDASLMSGIGGGVLDMDRRSAGPRTRQSPLTLDVLRFPGGF